jgi:hypothetical protein
LAASQLAYEALAIFTKTHNRWGGASALGVGDDYWLATFHDGYHRVGCAQINADYFTHPCIFPI